MSEQTPEVGVTGEQAEDGAPPVITAEGGVRLPQIGASCGE